MRIMYFYNIYGKAVGINVKLPLLKEIETVDCDIHIFVEYTTIDGDEGIHIIEDAGKFTVQLGKLALYTIDTLENRFYCKSRDFEAFFSTLFNIPFSVYCLSKNEILFHASSLVYNGQVICLTGCKGAGKSTLTEILNQYDEFQIFGDDTVCIDNNLICNRAHNLLKQTPETVNALEIKTLDEKNVAGKFYTNFNSDLNTSKIKKIIQIVRTESDEFELKLATTHLKINNIFKTNIVGISHMPFCLIAKALKLNIDSNVCVYELFVPNNLKCLLENKIQLKELIINSFQ